MSLVFTTNPEDATYRQNDTASAMTAVAVADSGYVDYLWQYSLDGSSFSNCIDDLFDITDGTNPIVTDSSENIEGYKSTYEVGAYIPSTSTIGIFYYRCQARKTDGRTEETAYSSIATIEIIQATVPVILGFSYSKNPCSTGEAILVTATITEQ